MKVLLTGTAGYIGSRLLQRLAKSDIEIIATDIRKPGSLPAAVEFVTCDVRDEALAELFQKHRPDVVVHLAAVVTPGRDSTPEIEYSIDVGGTENVLRACLSAGVRRLIVTSSGAAYGYHADHPQWIGEATPLRGNREFPYSWHKHLVEQLLAAARRDSPQLEQTVFRVSTVLGRDTRNQITALFDKPVLVSVTGGDDRFVLIWDEDVVRCLEQAVFSDRTGVFNLCADGAITMREMAVVMNKPYLRIPAGLLRLLFGILKPLRLTRYGPEQVNFLRYRPVLLNTALKEQFGFVPELTSREVFAVFASARERQR